jgi:hypothetical protein
MQLLESILHVGGKGKPRKEGTLQSEKRRVLRNSTTQQGLAFKAGRLFDAVLKQININHKLSQYPVKLCDVMRHVQGGPELLAKAARVLEKGGEDEVMAQAALDMTAGAGRACSKATIGILAQNNLKGSVKATRISTLTGYSRSYVFEAKKQIAEGNLGIFGSMAKSGVSTAQTLCRTRLSKEHGKCQAGDTCKYLHDCQCCKDGSQCAASECPKWSATVAKQNNNRRMNNCARLVRRHLPESEEVATRKWMYATNPARSGDQKEICWMIMPKDDFYFEVYRTPREYIEIIIIALDLYGDELRDAVRSPTNNWLRNVKTYLDALQDGALESIIIRDIRTESKVNMDDVLAEAGRREKKEKDAPAEPEFPWNEQEDIKDVEEEENDSEGVPRFYPRCKKYFYRQVLKGMRLWNRPPHNHCERCGDYLKAKQRIIELQTALLSTENDPEHETHAAVVKRAGGSTTAWKTVRALANKVPDLQKHVNWEKETRPFLKRREVALELWETQWHLDYGGFNDSANKKVSVWSVTVMAKGRDQEHFDYFFDQAPSKDSHEEGTAKKDGLTGIYFLREMLDPAKSPENDGVSVFQKAYPGKTHLLLSGDTGNGYRSYAMLEELGTIFAKFGYTIELAPLAPGHAWNRTDARLAHMNTFLGALKACSRVFGAQAIAEAFHAASDSKLKNRRKYMARSHVFFRRVDIDRSKAKSLRKTLGAHVSADDLDGGHMGVKGLLYFDFTVKGLDGVEHHPHGYARVREYADPDRPDNVTHVYAWCKKLEAHMCQPCSDQWGGPVLLTAAGCTKKKCAVLKEKERVAASEADKRQNPSQPLLGSPLDPDEDKQQGAGANNDPVGDGQDRQLRGREEDGVGAAGSHAPPAVAQQKQNKTKSKSAPSSAITRVTRRVRAVHGSDGNETAIWLYVPLNRSDKSNTQRRGWWLYPEPERARHYYIGPLVDIQKNKTIDKVEDVACFDDFPFDRTIMVDQATGEDLPKTERCVTSRPLTTEELTNAKNGEDIDEMKREHLDSADTPQKDASDCVEGSLSGIREEDEPDVSDKGIDSDSSELEAPRGAKRRRGAVLGGSCVVGERHAGGPVRRSNRKQQH